MEPSCEMSRMRGLAAATAPFNGRSNRCRAANNLSKMGCRRPKMRPSCGRLDSLPADYRQVIALRYWEDLEFHEIGKRMGRSAGAARKLWLRAVERLELGGGLGNVEP